MSNGSRYSSGQPGPRRIAGRVRSVEDDRVTFGDDLRQQTAAADHQMGRLLTKIDRHIVAHGLDSELPSPDPWTLTPQIDAPRAISLRRSGIRSVLWATGYRRSYPWLDADVLDAHGEVRNHRGRTSAAGLYFLGLQFMIRRNSSFIDGVGRDAQEIAAAIAGSSARNAREAAA